MAKKSVFSRPEAKESHSRNAFDRSFIKNFNFSAGMLIPTFSKFCFGHSHVRINQDSFVRTADINKPAFPSMPMYTDYYFVPMHRLITCWNAFRSQTNDRRSSLLEIPKNLPSFSVGTLRDAIFQYEGTDGDLDGANGSWVQGAFRLLDILDYGVTRANFNGSLDAQGELHNELPPFGSSHPLAAAAYQCVYFDHYRNTAYERNVPYSYNFDYNYSPGSMDGQQSALAIGPDQFKEIFTLRYANYRRDYFNTIYPSLNFISSVAGEWTSTKFNLPSNIQGLGYITTGGVLTSVSTTTPIVSSMGVSPNRANSNSGVAPGFTLQNLRAAFALEKLARVSAFAPQHVVDQFEARFGYRPKSASMDESIRLGSFQNVIIAGEVTQTATTQVGQTEAKLGQVGGKGVGASKPSQPISFDVPEDGYIVGITYVLPRMTYDAYRVDSVHQKLYPEDWSLPEFENLGLQPLLAKNVFMMKYVPEDQDNTILSVENGILGYQPRDMEFKASVSTNHGLFLKDYNQISNGGHMLSDYVFHGKTEWLELLSRSQVNGVNKNFFKCVPNDLDSIFAEEYDGTESTDQFFGQMVVNFACIQDKPVFGVPRL